MSCSEPDTGPVEIKWDRDACERCRMVLSDRLHSAQVRGGPQGGKSKVYKFDDFGGAVLWLQDKPWKDDAKTEIWVNDHRDGHWIDGRKAWYITGQITPMEFGLGAQDTAVDNALNYQQAIDYIVQREARFNAPGVDLKEQMNEHKQHSH
ncbi:MAG: nitrous oxide reductase accessory protein NosL [Gammaproteobacteria bacterium]|nr:nitrous oxide reductase accessory protein NosL [Gammaproteobacteria bacterium]